MDTPSSKTLPPPAYYFPPACGRYRVSPDLQKLGTDFGNGAADGQLFQIDADYAHYLAQKHAARDEQLEKYYRDGLDEAARRAVQAFLVRRLCAEHPRWFRLEEDAEGRRLHCALSGEVLAFTPDFAWRGGDCAAGRRTPWASGIDALACQLQEDLSVVQRIDGEDRLRCVHLCFPNHWAAADKFAQPFAAMHRPVAGMEEVNRRSGALMAALIQRGPYVRFAWGLASDTRLNHHPEPPPGEDPARWAGRDFVPGKALYLRVERQTLHGLPEIDAVLFTIRTYFVDLRRLRETEPAHCRQLADAIASMRPAQLAYKGLATRRDALIDWLRESVSQGEGRR